MTFFLRVCFEPVTSSHFLQYANDLDTAVKIWDMKSGRCVWSINEKSVLAVYKLYVSAASSTIFVGHSLGKVSVYQLIDGNAQDIGCHRTSHADGSKLVARAVSASFLSDLGSAISDEGSFDCHSSSGNIVRSAIFLRFSGLFTDFLQRCLVAFLNGQTFFTSAFDDSLDRSIKCFSLQNEHPLHIANTKVIFSRRLHHNLSILLFTSVFTFLIVFFSQGMRVNRLMLTNDEQTLVSGHIGEVCLWKSVDLVKLSSIPDKSESGFLSSVGHHQAASFSCLAISHSTNSKPEFLFTACYNDERDCDVRRWQLEVLEKPRCVATSPSEDAFLPIFQLELSPNGAKLLTAHGNGRICIWDAESMKLDKSISVVNGSLSITSVVTDREWTTFSAFSNSELTSMGIFCYSLDKNEVMQRLVCDALPQRMVYSDDGSYLLAGYSDGCIRKWNIKSGQMHSVFRSGWNDEYACSCAMC